MSTLFSADEFWSAPPKFKQPFEYVVSVLRALNFNVTNSRHFLRGIVDPLQAMGQVPLTWPQPNGFPDTQDEWVGGLLDRWNLALAAVTNEIPGARMNFEPILDLMTAQQIPMEIGAMLGFMGTYLLGRALSSDEENVVVDYARQSAGDLQTQFAFGTALLLASPAFQYR